MCKVIVTLACVLFVFAASDSSASCGCTVTREIEITRVHPRLRLSDLGDRRDSISITTPVACNSRMDIQPANAYQAVEFLDKALPLDFKVSLLEGVAGSRDVVPYGVSVEEDLMVYFTQLWKLEEEANLCKDIKLMADNNHQLCFYDLLDFLKKNYSGK